MTRKWATCIFCNFFIRLGCCFHLHFGCMREILITRLDENFFGVGAGIQHDAKENKLENYSSLASPDQKKKFFLYMSEKGGLFLFFLCFILMCIRFSVTQRTIKKSKGEEASKPISFFPSWGAEQTCRIRKPRFLEEGPRQKLSLTRSGVEAKEENFLSPLFFVLKGGGGGLFLCPPPRSCPDWPIDPHTQKTTKEFVELKSWFLDS